MSNGFVCYFLLVLLKPISFHCYSGKRGMNGDIILQKIRIAPSQVAFMVDSMDCGNLSAVELKTLFEFMPTEEESKGLTSYLEKVTCPQDAIAEMTPCEQYMVAMKDLKDSAQKFQSMIFLAEFKGKMNELKRGVDHLCAACQGLIESTRFQAFLAMSLEVVNKINSGDNGSAIVAGFSMDSLMKLSEVR